MGRGRTGAGLDYSGPNDLLRPQLYLAKSRFTCAQSIAGNVVPISLLRRCFPRHKSIERSSSLVRNKFDDMRVIDQPEKRGLVRNQIEWVHKIIYGCNNPKERVIGNLMVFPSMVGAN